MQEPLPLPGATAFGDDVIRTVVQAIEQLGNGSKKDKFEAGVLDSLKALGEVLEREFIAPSIVGLDRDGRVTSIIAAQFLRGSATRNGSTL